MQTVVKKFAFYCIRKKKCQQCYQEKKKMLSLSAKERKGKKRVAIKEFCDKLSNLVKMQYEMETINPINEQQLIEIDELYD